MKKIAMVATAALSCALMATTAFAHDHRGGHRGDREWRSQNYERGYREGRRDARRDERRAERRHDRGHGWDRRDWRGPPVVVVPAPPRHHGPRWSRGDRLPPHYRQPQYVVHDWRARQFREPPRGYQWVNAGGAEYLLVGIATGVILQSIIGR